VDCEILPHIFEGFTSLRSREVGRDRKNAFILKNEEIGCTGIELIFFRIGKTFVMWSIGRIFHWNKVSSHCHQRK